MKDLLNGECLDLLPSHDTGQPRFDLSP